MAKVQLGPLVTSAIGKLDDRDYTERRKTRVFKQRLGQDYPDTVDQQLVKDRERKGSELWRVIDNWYFGDPREADLRFDDMWAYIVRTVISPPRPAFVGSLIHQLGLVGEQPEGVRFTTGKAYAPPLRMLDLQVRPSDALVTYRTPRRYHRDTIIPLAFLVLMPVFEIGGGTVPSDYFVVYRPIISREPDTVYTGQVFRPDDVSQWDLNMLCWGFMCYVRQDLNVLPVPLQVRPGATTLISESRTLRTVVMLPVWTDIPDQMLEVLMPVNLNLQTFVDGSEPITIDVMGLPQGLVNMNGLITGAVEVEGTFPISVVARNDFGESRSSFEITAEDVVTAPVWSMVDVGTWRTDMSSSLDLNNFVRGNPTPTIRFNNFADRDVGILFSDGVLSGMPLNARNADLTFTATNEHGSESVTINLNIEAVGVSSFNPPETIRVPTSGTFRRSFWIYARNCVDFVDVPLLPGNLRFIDGILSSRALEFVNLLRDFTAIGGDGLRRSSRINILTQ